MKRAQSFCLIFFIYFLAFGVGYTVYYFLPNNIHPILSMFLADIAATVIVWLSGIISKNPSMYDPYWSVAPPIIIICWLFQKGLPITSVDILLIIGVGFWAIRLTYNWAKGFAGINKTQDWRYIMLKERNPKLFFLTNLFGINLIPTTLVYMGLVPLYFMLFGYYTLNIFTFIGFSIMIFATTLQLIADKQLAVFRKQNIDKSNIMDKGLWAYSRHPNYFGEISMWWGIFVFSFGNKLTPLYSVIGALGITLLFLFISIPMMEKKMVKNRPLYKNYIKDVSMLMPMPNKRQKEKIYKY